MKVLSREDVLVDAEYAFNLLTNPYEKQRPLMRKTVTDYKDDMAAGRWHLGEGQIVVGVRPSGKYLISGQHRMTAVYELETVKVPFTVVHIEFESDDEMKLFYATGTNKGKPMGINSSLLVLGTKDSIGIPHYFVTSATSAMGMIVNSFRTNYLTGPIARQIKSPEAMHAVLQNFAGPLYAFYRLMDGCSSKVRDMFRRQAVMAVALVTLRECPEKALEFWRLAAENDGLRRGEPAHHLRTFLAESNTMAGIGLYDYASTVAACWNLYYRGETRQVLRKEYGRTSDGILILGTLFKGRGDEPVLKYLTEGAVIK